MQTIKEKIEAKILNALQPTHLEVINESNKHNVPSGSESHFKLIIVADTFVNQPLIERHRAINYLLADELAGSIHALALRTLTPEEWQTCHGTVSSTPPCLSQAKKI